MSWLGNALHDSGIRVQFYGNFDGISSIPNVCRQWVRVLGQRIDGFGAHNVDGTPWLGDDRIDHLRAWSPRAAVAVFYGFPLGLPPILRRWHEVLIGAFVCETDRIPDAWVRVCNTLDLVVVPSQFCRRAFVASGVHAPVEVVPHGVDEEFTDIGPTRRDARFTFFDTFAAQSFPERKGAEEVIRSFGRAFQGRRDVVLRLRTEHTDPVRRWLDDYRARDLIRIDPPRPLSALGLARLYRSVHCTVHPSKGEGFGLVPLQSIACATPVIAPAATGMADYLDEGVAMLLRTTGWAPGVGWDAQCGRQRVIDEDHLVDLLRQAERTWEAERARAVATAPAFRERWSWGRALAPLAERLQQMGCVSRPSATHFPVATLPRTGIATAGAL